MKRKGKIIRKTKETSISVDINIEHSFIGDLDILLTAPNGVSVILIDQSGGGIWLGQAHDGESLPEFVGIGYDYGWSMNPEYNGTMSDAIAADNFVTLDNLNPDQNKLLNKIAEDAKFDFDQLVQLIQKVM